MLTALNGFASAEDAMPDDNDKPQFRAPPSFPSEWSGANLYQRCSVVWRGSSVPFTAAADGRGRGEQHHDLAAQRERSLRDRSCTVIGAVGDCGSELPAL